MPQTALATIQTFLRTADDRAQGAALFDLYAEDAQLFVAGEVQPKSDLDRATFALAIAERQSPRPEPRLEATALIDEQRTGDRHTAWFEAVEAGTGRAFALGAGFRVVGDALKIEWVLLADERPGFGDAMARAQMLADYAFAIGGAYDTPRHWLDVAHYRLAGHDRPALQVLPGARFSCQGATNCCEHNFRIELPASAQAAIDALPWDELAPGLGDTTLTPLPSGELLLKDAREVCRFLDENRRCRLHAALGRPLFTACANYPILFAPTPHGVAVSSSFGCPTVRANIGAPLEERADDLYARMAMGLDPLPDAFLIAPGQEVDWDDFEAAETILMDLLDRTDLPLHRRLWLGGRMLMNFETSGLLVHAEFETEAITPAPPPVRAFQGQVLRLFASGFEDEDLQAFDGEFGHATLPDEAVLVSMMKNIYFSKKYAYFMNLTAAHNVVSALYVMALHAHAKAPEGHRAFHAMRQLGVMFMNGTFLAKLGALMENAEQFKLILSDPTFGLGLLSYPSGHAAKV